MKPTPSDIGLRLALLAGNVLCPNPRRTPRRRLADLDAPTRVMMFALVAAIVLTYTPDLVLAAPGSGDIGPHDVAAKFLSGAKAWWTFFAQLAVIGGLVGAVFMFFVDKRWVMVPLGIAGIGAFGEDIAAWFLTQGSHSGLTIGSKK